MMPGGSSVGPDGNARVLVVRDGHGLVRTHRSIEAALAHRNRELRAQGLPVLGRGEVYPRLAAGWSPEEALGYQPHEDGRGRREAFWLHGVSYISLATASAVTGLGQDAQRSRLHRARRRAPDAAVVDITVDRRAQGRGCGTPLGIVWPGTGEVLTAEQFGARTGVAKATVLHRWHRAQADAELYEEELTPEELHARLVTCQDRRNVLLLDLPDGRDWRGGERELIRRLFADPALEAERAVRLSESGIRRRLRLLSEDERLDGLWLLWAFGFLEEAPAYGDNDEDTDHEGEDHGDEDHEDQDEDAEGHDHARP